MKLARREFVAGAAAAAAVTGRVGSLRAAAPITLKLSHQFPGGTDAEGDFRDRLSRKFAAEVEKRTNGALKVEVYAASSLMKTNAQISSLRKGGLDMSLCPLPYGGGEIAEANIGLMPGVCTSYEQGASWRTKPVGKALADALADKGILFVTWIWQAGGVASRAKPLVEPEDSKGMKVRGGSREMDMVLKEAGAAVISLPSNDIYAAMQTGALDAAMTSSTSLISYRLEEVAKSLTTGRGAAYWFMIEPLMISKDIFQGLPKDVQDVIMAVGAEMESFAVAGAKADDQAVADVYKKAGAQVFDLSKATVAKWQDIARATAWKDFAARSDSCANILKLAEQTL